jgi:hypothetical protein
VVTSDKYPHTFSTFIYILAFFSTPPGPSSTHCLEEPFHVIGRSRKPAIFFVGSDDRRSDLVEREKGDFNKIVNF